MKTNKASYIVEYRGEPVCRLIYEGDKANVTTGDIADAIRYSVGEAVACAAAIGSGAEVIALEIQ